MSDEGEKKYSGDNYRGAEHAAPYPVSRLGAPVSLVDTAREIESASATVAMRTNAQLELILDQMRTLQERARAIMAQASRDIDLIHVECGFRRVPGRLYHLYERADGHRFFSMVSPEEYGRPSSRFVGSFRYEADQSWTPAEEVAARDKRRSDIQAFASGRLLRE